MTAGFNLANKPDSANSAKLGKAELTIDYTIPELIPSIELVQRQVRIQRSRCSQKRSIRRRKGKGTEGNLPIGAYGCAMCVNEQTGICI